MKRLLLLLTLCATASAQNLTVVSDTNRVIRTNFTLVRSQVTDLDGASFAISNITGLQNALDGKLATNGSAAALTNFPSSLLTTNGDGSGLTNLPNANLTNATGVLPIVSGGTGQTNAEAAIEALLPAYTNNADKILALNSNATGLVWTTNAGGGTNTNTGGITDLSDTTNGVTNTLGVANGGTGGTNRTTALEALGIFTTNNAVRLDNSTNVAANGRHITIGSGIYATNVGSTFRGVAIGDGAEITHGGIAIGYGSDAAQGIGIGTSSYSDGFGVAIGNDADVRGGSTDPVDNRPGGVAIGEGAVSYTNAGGAVGHGTATYGGGAIGESAFTRLGASIGFETFSSNGVAAGSNAWTRDGVALGPDSRTTNGVQLLAGTNLVDNTIQFLSAGSVDTNEWAALANAGAFGTNILQATNSAQGRSLLLPAYASNEQKVLAVATNGTDVEWIAVSNTVTDASTLTNFPTLNQNTTGTASNVTGIIQITNGGTGTNSAAGARVNLLPSYTGNSNKVLAVNAGETDVEWVVQSGGGGGLTSPVAVVDGGTGATNATAALVNLLPSYTGNSNRFLALNPTETGVLWTNFTATVDLASANATGILPTTKGGTGNSLATSTGRFYALYNLGVYSSTNTTSHGVQVGDSASATNFSVAIGADADALVSDSVAIGADAKTRTGSDYGIAIGKGATTTNGNFAIAIGWQTRATAANAVQIGAGPSVAVTNSTANTIQFMNAGTVNTNKWAALANAGTIGTNVLRSTNAADAQAAIFPATTTNAPTNTNAPTPDAWLDVTVGTNAYKLPLWQ